MSNVVNKQINPAMVNVYFPVSVCSSSKSLFFVRTGTLQVFFHILDFILLDVALNKRWIFRRSGHSCVFGQRISNI